MKHVVKIHFRTSINSDQKIPILPVDCFKGKATLEASQDPASNALILKYKAHSAKDTAEIISWYANRHGHDTFEIVYSMDTKVDENK